MTTQQLRSGDSSVVLNLRQLMQLEDERVAAERAAREATDRERADREQRAREDEFQRELEQRSVLARLRLEADAAARAEIERQAALLRVRLEVEAAAHAECERARARPIELAAPRRSPTWFVAATLGLTALGCLGIGAGLAGLGLRQPATPAAISVSRQQLQTPRDEQLAELHPHPRQLTTHAAAVTQPGPIVSPPRRDETEKRLRPKPGGKRRDLQRARPPADELPSFDFDTDDPIENL